MGGPVRVEQNLTKARHIRQLLLILINYLVHLTKPDLGETTNEFGCRTSRLVVELVIELAFHAFSSRKLGARASVFLWSELCTVSTTTKPT